MPRVVGVPMMLLSRAVVVVVMVVIVRGVVMMVVIGDAGMNVEVGALITMVAMPDRAVCSHSSRIDPQPVGGAQGAKSPVPARTSRDEPLHRQSPRRQSRLD